MSTVIHELPLSASRQAAAAETGESAPARRATPASRGPRPDHDWDKGRSWPALGLILLLHVAVLWGLLQIQSVREAVADAAPIMVGLITLAPEPPQPEPPPPPKPMPVKPKPKPQMIAAQTAAPAPVTAPPPEPVAVEEPPPPRPQGEPAPAPIIPPSFVAAYLDNPSPQYPASSRRLGESGTVTLRVLVGEDGRAASVDVHSSSGFSRLDRAAIDAVRKWKFVPARQGERPIAATVLVPLSFEIKSS